MRDGFSNSAIFVRNPKAIILLFKGKMPKCMSCYFWPKSKDYSLTFEVKIKVLEFVLFLVKSKDYSLAFEKTNNNFNFLPFYVSLRFIYC